MDKCMHAVLAGGGPDGDKVAVGMIYFRESESDMGLGVAAGGHGWPAGARHCRHDPLPQEQGMDVYAQIQ